MKCAANDDVLTLRSDEGGDTISFVFEAASQGKVSNFELKLIDIDGDFLGIPETEYNASITMSSSEFAKICHDLTILGDTVVIEAKKEVSLAYFFPMSFQKSFFYRESISVSAVIWVLEIFLSSKEAPLPTTSLPAPRLSSLSPLS